MYSQHDDYDICVMVMHPTMVILIRDKSLVVGSCVFAIWAIYPRFDHGTYWWSVCHEVHQMVSRIIHQPIGIIPNSTSLGRCCISHSGLGASRF